MGIVRVGLGDFAFIIGVATLAYALVGLAAAAFALIILGAFASYSEGRRI